MADSLIHLGTLLRPHGIKGEISADWHAASLPPPDALLWITGKNSPPQRVRALSCRRHQGRLLFLFEGVADRTAADALRGQKLLVERAVLPEPAEDESYVQDLLGGDVLLPDGRRLGRFDHLECPAGQDIWVIITDGGDEILFPAQPCFIQGFDAAKRAVQINPPEGLLDVYLS
ncbi:MAG: ribosome maturation factor RimM [Desulfovibrio sp.]|jgi:16S rRNA processing protein RimM|nr:ribosome maturation factor RimM [Desulfovibrio sp.]